MLDQYFSTDVAGEYKIKAVLYYNHEKYISNEIFILIETASEKASRIKNDADVVKSITKQEE